VKRRKTALQNFSRDGTKTTLPEFLAAMSNGRIRIVVGDDTATPPVASLQRGAPANAALTRLQRLRNTEGDGDGDGNGKGDADGNGDGDGDDDSGTLAAASERFANDNVTRNCT
jgi:hypothetical protein